MRKILFYINAINGGGAARVMVNLANDFANIGVETVLVTSFRDAWEYPLAPKVKRLSLEDEQVIQSRIKRNVSRILKLRRFLKQEKPDVVVSFMREPNFRAMIASRGLPLKTVISIRNAPQMSYSGRINSFIARFILPLADGCIFQTEDSKKWFPEKLQKKSAIIYNAVKEEFFNVERNPIRREVVTCGRLEPQKNHEMLIKAFAKCREMFPNASLKIYGDGSLKENLQNLIDSLGISDVVSLCGSIRNVEEVLQKAEIFVLSSDYEGMPNALMEALAVGIPCISTDCPCGGPKELIIDGCDGVLTPVGDVEAMTKALAALMEDQDRMDQMGKKAAKRAERYRPEKIFTQWKEYIESIVN